MYLMAASGEPRGLKENEVLLQSIWPWGKTGIDLPQESAGMQTNPKIVGGLLLDEAIGQFDTYTPLQLAQYVSTIAVNGGYRLQPRVVKSIHQPESEKLGPVIEERSANVLNRITTILKATSPSSSKDLNE